MIILSYSSEQSQGFINSKDPDLDELDRVFRQLDKAPFNGLILMSSKLTLVVHLNPEVKRYQLLYREDDTETDYCYFHSLIDVTIEAYDNEEYQDADHIEFIAHNGESLDAPRRHTVSFTEAYEATMYIYQHQTLPPFTTWEQAYV